MRSLALVVLGLTLLAAMPLPAAHAGCSTMLVPQVGSSGFTTCDANGDGFPEIVLVTEGIATPTVSAEGVSVSGIAAGTSTGAAQQGQFLTAGSGSGASTTTPLGPLGLAIFAQCATNTNNLGCDRSDGSAAIYTPVGAAGAGQSLHGGSPFVGAGASSIVGSGGAFVAFGPRGPQACATTPAGGQCSPLLA